MARKILITSGKGGVGKTSVCAYLGYQLSKLGERVVIIDMDLGLNNLDACMGVEDKVIYDLKDVLDGRCRVKQTLINISQTLSIIPSRHTIYDEVSGNNVRALTDGLSAQFDYILVDSPAGIDTGFHRSALSCDEAILVVTPSLTSLRDGDKVLGLLNNYEIKKIGIVVNKVRGDLEVQGLVVTKDEISGVLKLPVIGCIPDDDDILLGANLSLKNTRAGQAFKALAKYLKRGTGKVYDCTLYYKGIGGAIRRSLKRNA